MSCPQYIQGFKHKNNSTIAYATMMSNKNNIKMINNKKWKKMIAIQISIKTAVETTGSKNKI